MSIDSIQVEEMAAGTDGTTIWVSLGFKSDISPFDVLFIVCAKEKSEQFVRAGYDALYYERFDQGMSCYGGADSINVEASAITVHFTPLGIKRLKLSETVCFDVSTASEHFAKVREHLQAMRSYRWGSIISDSLHT